MKQLNTYIQEGLFKNVGVGSTAYIEKWINDNYNVKGLSIIESNGKFIANAKTAELRKDSLSTSLTNGDFEWGEINYAFRCKNLLITTLEGGPKKCDTFYVYGDSLTSLEGAPQECEEFFVKDLTVTPHTKKLTSLKGCENMKCKNFCVVGTNLKSIEFAPKTCKEFDCSGNLELTSLKGLPKGIQELTCVGCIGLKSLKDMDIPEKLNLFDCCNSGIESLEGGPKICDDYRCHGCRKLKSLDGAPSECKSFDCSYCPNINTTKYKIKKLTGATKITL